MVILTDDKTCVKRDCDHAPDGIRRDGRESASCQLHEDEWQARLDRYIARAPSVVITDLPELPEELQCAATGCVAPANLPDRYCDDCRGHHGESR